MNVAEPSSANGGACYVMAAVNATGLTTSERGALKAASGAYVTALHPCPAQPVAAGAGAPAAGSSPAPAAAPARQASPVQLATRFWDSVPLPAPHPKSQPDFAITGKRTYLTTGDSNHPPAWTKRTPFGALSIAAVGTYVVDWGDGTTTGPYSTTGAPYPHGTITHTYDRTGRVTITVHERWRATWRIGRFHGALGGLHTTGTLPDFRIRQVQAVITQSQ